MTQFETLLNQVYAAWLGKLIGILGIMVFLPQMMMPMVLCFL